MSNILLFCIHPYIKNEQISENQIYDLVSTVGKVKDMVLFAKGKTWKYFVEMESSVEADQTISKLNKVSIDIGKINVYKSNKKKLQKPNSLIYDQERNDLVSNEFQFSAKSSKIEIFDKNEKWLISKNYFSHNEQNNNNQSKFLKESKNKKRVIFFKFTELKKITPQILLNMFGSFGNVKKLFINLKNKFILVEMETQKQTEMSFKYLNDLTIFDLHLSLHILSYSNLNSEYIQNKKNQRNFIFLMGHYKYFRYKQGLSIKINPPSNLLHITSVSKKLCPIILYEIIKVISKPLKIFKLAQKGYLSYMFLIAFKNKNESLQVLSFLHNKKIDNKMLKVSFSHTKLS